MSAECHCGVKKKAQNEGDAGKGLVGALAAVSGRWGRGRKWAAGVLVDGEEAKAKGESEQRARPGATPAAGSDWYTSQL